MSSSIARDELNRGGRRKCGPYKREKTKPSNRTSYPKIIKINRGRKLLGKRKTNPSREYRKSVGERNGTTSRKFYILHSISYPAEPLKRGVKILPGRSAQTKWRQRWSLRSTAGCGYRYGVPPNSRGRQRGAYYDSLGKNKNKKSKHAHRIYKNLARATSHLSQGG